MNHWAGIGRLVRDPNVKYTQSGKAYASFTLAIDRRKSGDGNHQADFISCVAWEKLAEVISQYVSKLADRSGVAYRRQGTKCAVQNRGIRKRAA